MKDYRVTCETKKGGLQHWVIDITASNAKEVKKKFDELWDKDAHPFNIQVRKLRGAEEFLYHWFSKLDL